VTQFISEAIAPEAGSADIGAMSRGEPGLPRSFLWRGTRYEIASVEGRRRSTGTDRGDVYVRKHFFDIVTRCGKRMTVFFERNPTNKTARKHRWWLYSIET
jgi:hypothetical protein